MIAWRRSATASAFGARRSGSFRIKVTLFALLVVGQMMLTLALQRRAARRVSAAG